MVQLQKIENVAGNVILWFKNDLRITDNESLIKAVASGRKILPVFIFDVQKFRKLDIGFPKTDYVSFEFLRQCVDDLRKSIKQLGGNLMVRTGRPEVLVPRLAREYGCETIFAEQEFASEEIGQLDSIRKALLKGCNLDLTWGRTLYHIDDIPFPIAKIPSTSKAYRIPTAKNTEIRPTMPAPKEVPCLDLAEDVWGDLPIADDVGLPGERNFALTYMEGGETRALERLEYYFFETEQLTRYRWTRNRSLGLEYSSKLSPYMATGCLSPRTIYEAVKRYEKEVKKNQSTWWLVFEMVWRDYFTFKLMKIGDKVYGTKGYLGKPKKFSNDPDLFGRWMKGETGVPFIDAHMRQLNETGFMSNRGRVNCSSFLIYDYEIDWTWGAAYFESKLIDYDVASNWMNWHAQAFQTWYTNPVNQALKYSAQDFIRKWVPELQHLNDVEVLIPWESAVKEYPLPHTVFDKWNRAINKIKSQN